MSSVTLKNDSCITHCFYFYLLKTETFVCQVADYQFHLCFVEAKFFFSIKIVKTFSFEIIDIHTIHLNKNSLSVYRPWILKMILFPHLEMLKLFFLSIKKIFA